MGVSSSPVTVLAEANYVSGQLVFLLYVRVEAVSFDQTVCIALLRIAFRL